jgi:hypothetical protein
VAVSEVVREAGVVGAWMGVLLELEERAGGGIVAVGAEVLVGVAVGGAVERVAEWVAAIVKRPGLRR